MEKKTCQACNKEFTLEHFNYQSRKTGRLRPYCKYCDRARARKDYRDNREHKLQVMKDWYDRTGYKAPGNYIHNKIPGVYMIVNIETGERYVGSSKNVYRRRSSWVVKNNHLNIDLTKCIWGVIEETDDYKEREKYWIKTLNPELNTVGKVGTK